MKMRNKGKIHPSPSSSSSSSSPSLLSHSQNRDSLSILKLLPAAILALASVLSLEDKQVLAYMITRSIKSTNPSSIIQEKKKNSKKSNTHKPHVFECECFDCYISYWYKWDSSPNRELIHQVIEAFEEHLNNGEQSRKNRNKKREKMGRRGGSEKLAGGLNIPATEIDNGLPVVEDDLVEVLLESDVSLVGKGEVGSETGEYEVGMTEMDLPDEEVAPLETEVVVLGTAANNHKGLARKVLPDVLGLFNSRLWSLWSPNA